MMLFGFMWDFLGIYPGSLRFLTGVVLCRRACVCGAAAGVDGARFWRVPTKLVGGACRYLLSSLTGGEGDFFFFATRLCDLAVARGDETCGHWAALCFSPVFLFVFFTVWMFFFVFLSLGLVAASALAMRGTVSLGDAGGGGLLFFLVFAARLWGVATTATARPSKKKKRQKGVEKKRVEKNFPDAALRRGRR